MARSIRQYATTSRSRFGNVLRDQEEPTRRSKRASQSSLSSLRPPDFFGESQIGGGKGQSRTGLPLVGPKFPPIPGNHAGWFRLAAALPAGEETQFQDFLCRAGRSTLAARPSQYAGASIDS